MHHVLEIKVVICPQIKAKSFTIATKKDLDKARKSLEFLKTSFPKMQVDVAWGPEDNDFLEIHPSHISEILDHALPLFD